MPYKDPAVQAEYQRRWMAQRRQEWFDAHGPCSLCGSSERLELDHIDPALKVSHRLWSWSALKREAELTKCRVLCYSCHRQKSRGERAPQRGELNGNAKLTVGQVRQIRTMTESSSVLGLMFGVHSSTIRAIRLGIRWESRDITEETRGSCSNC